MLLQELKRLMHSFNSAFTGIKDTIVLEKNMQIHAWISIFVILLCSWSGIEWWQFLIILFFIFWVWTLELVNTAVENVFDLVNTEIHPMIKWGKDAAAGAVLLSSIFAVIVGVTILLEPLLDKVEQFHDLLTIDLVPTAFQLAVMICIWFFLFGVLIKINHRFKDSLILIILGFSILFALFIWSSNVWLQMLMLLCPFFIIIFLRRGYATLFGIFQVVISGFAVYLLYYLLK